MIVRAYDKSHRMMRARKQRTFKNQTVSDIVKKVASEHGLSVSSEASGAPLDLVFQHNETDWDFVWRLARRVGFEFVVDDVKGDLREARGGRRGRARLPRRPSQLPPAHHLRAAGGEGQRPRLRPQGQEAGGQHQELAEPDDRGRDQAQRRDEEVQGIPARDLGPVVLDRGGRPDRPVDARPARQRLPRRRGQLPRQPEDQGRHEAEDHRRRQDFSGTYRVAKAQHLIGTAGGYTTEFSNSAGEHTLLGQTGGSGNSSRNDSIITGIVTNNNDPEQLGRVQVKLPAVSDLETFWVPVLSPPRARSAGSRCCRCPGSTSWSRSRTATRPTPTCWARSSTARTRRARSWRSRMARSPRRATRRRCSPRRRTSSSAATRASGRSRSTAAIKETTKQGATPARSPAPARSPPSRRSRSSRTSR